MARAQGLQGFIERKAAGPAWGISVSSLILRGAEFYSHGAFNYEAMFGAVGVRIFEGFTGASIAVGAELLASVFGRQWLRYLEEEHEARGRSGMRKPEREALIASFHGKAQRSKAYMITGICASALAAFAFLQNASGASGIGAWLGEALIVGILVMIVSGFGIFYEAKPDDSREIASEQARDLRATIVRQAAARIAKGEHTPQDIRVFAGDLGKEERAHFMGAMLPETPDDPMWTANDILAFLGLEGDEAARKAVQRKLKKLSEAGEEVIKDARNRYALLRSKAVTHFAGDLVNMMQKQRQARPISATLARQGEGLNPLEGLRDSDSDRTATAAGQVA